MNKSTKLFILLSVVILYQTIGLIINILIITGQEYKIPVNCKIVEENYIKCANHIYCSKSICSEICSTNTPACVFLTLTQLIKRIGSFIIIPVISCAIITVAKYASDIYNYSDIKDIALRLSEPRTGSGSTQPQTV